MKSTETALQQSLVNYQQCFNNLIAGEKNKSMQIFSTAKLFGHLRNVAGIWQMIVYELLELDEMNIEAIAKEINVAPRTIKRILANHTRRPNIDTSFKLFKLHFRWRGDRYQEFFKSASAA